MPLLLALCLMATDGGTPGIELKVFRSREELPAQWAKQVPANFDFTTHQLATRARPGEPIELVDPARVEQQEGDLHLEANPPEPEEPRVCPPCRGIATRDLEPVRRMKRLPLFRLARSPGRAFLVQVTPQSLNQAAELSGGPCPICTAP